jgi:hypothetical protein
VHRRVLLRALVGAAGVHAAELCAGALAGCGGSTGGKLVRFEMGVSQGLASVDNAHGWQVELRSAHLALGPVQLFAGDAGVGEMALRWLEPARAYAHPGHYEEGNLMGETLEPLLVDLFRPTSPLEGHGVAGDVGSARLTFAPDQLDGLAVVLEGEARRAGVIRSFRATAAEDDVLSHHGEPEIWGCPFVGGPITSDGVVTLTIDVARWLREVDFRDEGDLDPLGRALFVAGVLDPQAYRFAFRPQ